MTKEFFNSISFNILLTLVFGIFTSYVDLHNDEVQPAVFLLLLFSFILGYKNPENAWLYSLLLGLSLIIGFLFSEIIGFKGVGPPPTNILWELLPLKPAFTGGYLGVFVRSIFKKIV